MNQIANHHLLLRRLCTRYLVPGDHPNPQGIPDRLDGIVTRSLSTQMSRMLGQIFPQSDPALWFIRRLELEMDVNAAANDHELGHAFAEQMTRRIAHTCADGADGLDVIRFTDRAEYFAQFLKDRATGRADQWYYHGFAGLKVLSVSAALSTAIADVPANGKAALLRLAPDALRHVLTQLTPADARRVLVAFTSDVSAADMSYSLDTAWAARKGMPQSAFFADDSRDALRLFLAIDCAGSVTLRIAITAIVCLVRRLSSATDSQAKQLIDALIGDDAPSLHNQMNTADAESLAPLRGRSASWMKEIFQSITTRPSLDSLTEPDQIYTSFGGVFLLLPMLQEIPLDEATADWPPLHQTPAAVIVRFLLLIKCLGQSRADEAFGDPLLRQLLGVTADVTLDSLKSWQAGIAPYLQRQLLSVLHRWQTDRGWIIGSSGVLALFEDSGCPTAVYLSATRGLWRSIHRLTPSNPHPIFEQIKHLISNDPAFVLACDPQSVEPLSALYPSVNVISRTNPSSSPPELAEVLLRLDTLAEDFNSLLLPIGWGFDDAMDLSLSIVAQSLMCWFAWRLPGFSRSSLSYLRSSFLDFAGSLEDQATRRVVRLGRPPLNVILDMTGMSRATYQVAWLDDRPFTLFSQT